MPKQNQQDSHHYCHQEARIVALETRLQNKKENLHEVHEDYYHLRDKLELISENVVELTTIMKENQKKEEQNEDKLDNLKTEIANLKSDIANSDTKIEKTNASLDTMKWLIPVACTIFTFIINYLM